jgi:hypothetical protein
MLSFTPARVVQAGPETAPPAGLSVNDWAQIEELLASALPSQQAYLKASNTGASDEFGYSVANSGDTVVVGAYNEDSSATGVNGDQNDNSAVNSGAVYVFTRSGTTWSQEAYLKASNAEAGDNFGFSVAIFGDTVIVGAYGEDSASPIVNGDQNDNSTPNSGAAYVFVRSGTTWSQQAYLKSATILRADMFGYSVAISGDTVVVGAYGEDSKSTGVNSTFTKKASLSGAAYVFTRDGITWSQQAYLKASNTELGDYFGWSVAVSGDTVVVGAFGEDSHAVGVDGDQTDNSAGSSGAAYIFTRSGTTWSQEAYLKASNTGASDYFGFSAAIAGDTVVIGAEYEDSHATSVNGDENDDSVIDSGAAYVFTRDGTTWSQQAYLKASNTGASDQFGFSVAVTGDTVVVGAPYEDSHASGVNGDQTDNSADSSGAAYVFTRDGTTWSQQAYIKASNTEASDYFGFQVASGDTVIVAAPYEDGNASGVNGDQNNNLMSGSGAAYVFTVPPTPDAFTKSSPTDGLTDQPINLTLNWNSATGATSYAYCYYITEPSDCDDPWTLTTTNTSVALSGLTANTTYHWQVRAVNSDGATDADSGTWWTFTTVSNSPGAFDKIDPANGAANQSLSPTLSWTSATGATSYEYCIYKTGDPVCADDAWTENGTATTKALTLLPATIYYWHVRAVNADGTTYSNGTETAFWSFTTQPQLSVYSTASQDGWILESTATSNTGGTLNSTATTFNLGDDTADKQYRAILSFDTIDLPDTAVITGVTLKIRVSGALVGNNSPFTWGNGLRVDVCKNMFGTTAALQLTDFNFNNAANCQLLAGRFGNTPTSDWYSADIANTAWSKVNKTGLTQFRLRFYKDDNDYGAADYWRFFSGDHATASLRPTLLIEYYIP